MGTPANLAVRTFFVPPVQLFSAPPPARLAVGRPELTVALSVEPLEPPAAAPAAAPLVRLVVGRAVAPLGPSAAVLGVEPLVLVVAQHGVDYPERLVADVDVPVGPVVRAAAPHGVERPVQPPVGAGAPAEPVVPVAVQRCVAGPLAQPADLFAFAARPPDRVVLCRPPMLLATLAKASALLQHP